MSAFGNRLAKNARHRFKWAARAQLTAFRLYDLDIPELPFAVDWYSGWVHVMEFPRSRQRKAGGLEAVREDVTLECARVLEVPAEKVFFKTHEPKAWGEQQYHRLGTASTTVVVEERGLKFECNLSDYLDTGLFLDHRVTRQRVREEANGRRFLNLFAYTGSFTVHARAGGAVESTTVDLSNTYCDWAERNLRLNGFEESKAHRVVRGDVLQWLERARGPFDLVVLDPPSFSASKKMARSFNVQRDHRRLIDQIRALLAPDGVLYFSTNYLSFELDGGLVAKELDSVPEDFRQAVHRCWRITK